MYWRDYLRECYMKLFISLLDTKENNNDFSNELTMQNCFSLSELVKKIRIVFFLGFFLSMLIGCDPAIQYRKLVKNQLNSGITNDTLFHGVYFGMTYDEYYNLYRNKYGPNFIQFKSNQSARPALVWVLGNQRITLFQKDEAKVNARFTNLRKTNS